MRTHRPIITRHTVHCLCGVFCGASPDRWFEHAADVHVLHPGELLDMTPISETAAAWQQARERARAAFQRLADAFAPLRRVLKGDIGV